MSCWITKNNIEREGAVSKYFLEYYLVKKIIVAVVPKKQI